MASSASGSIPKPHSRASKEKLLQTIFGSVDDPNGLSRQNMYKHMRNAAKATYRDIVLAEEGFERAYWDRIPHGLQERAIENLLKNEEFGSYFERSEGQWLPKYLLESYIKSHLDFKLKLSSVKASDLKNQPSSDGEMPDIIPGPSRPVETTNLSQNTLPGIREMLAMNPEGPIPQFEKGQRQ